MAGGLADSAGLQEIHSQRSAVEKAPDKMLWNVEDSLCCERLTDMRLTPRPPAVVVAAVWSPSRAALRCEVTGHDRGPALVDHNKPLSWRGPPGHAAESPPARPAVRSARGLKGAARPASAWGVDRVCDRVRHLPPRGLAAGQIDGKNRHVPMLHERLAGTCRMPQPLNCA